MVTPIKTTRVLQYSLYDAFVHEIYQVKNMTNWQILFECV